MIKSAPEADLIEVKAICICCHLVAGVVAVWLQEQKQSAISHAVAGDGPSRVNTMKYPTKSGGWENALSLLLRR